ncbi:MAG TPA: hypothetical protein VJ850_04380 [Candidatus Limnocylindrales bacterium]|nr:hypothetical protein [Candidatus Limnocylindrales bacterium]
MPAAEPRCYEPPTAALRARSVARLQAELTAYLGRAGDAIARDWRDVLVILATYHDCAVRLGADPVAIFDAASEGMPLATRDIATTFSRRQDITLEEFGWVLLDRPEGPCYADADPISVAELKAKIAKMGGHIS